MTAAHQPVLLSETITLLNCRPEGTYVDGTIGGGGHAQKLLQTCPDIKVLIGIDRDEEALAESRKKLVPMREKVVLVKGNYSDLAMILSDLHIKAIDGLLLDLGVSSMQLFSADRGFSFSLAGPLDMRMDRQQPTTAADLVNNFTERELARIFKEYGEEKRSAAIARAVVKRRKEHAIVTTTELADLVTGTIRARNHSRSIHPATRTFQALRIAVNDELTHLQKVLTEGIDHLTPGGRIAVISFHSLEDGMVKRTFRTESRSCVCPPRMPQCRCGQIPRLRVLTPRPIVPSAEEIRINHRARSARLRAAERV